MQVHAVCGYPGNSPAWEGEWKREHWQARNLVKGAKREDFNGYAEWTEQPSGRRLRQYGNAEGHRLALRAAVSKLINLIDAAGIKQASIVPVPSSRTVAPGSDFTGARLAFAIQVKRPGLVADPVIHFDQPQLPAHDGGGERRWQMILPHLRGGAGLAGEIILLDDVMTSGGHLRACWQFLADRGHQVDHAFVIGRTLWERPEKMFSIPVESLPW